MNRSVVIIILAVALLAGIVIGGFIGYHPTRTVTVTPHVPRPAAVIPAILPGALPVPPVVQPGVPGAPPPGHPMKMISP
jgi:hypothetical protein